MFSVKDCSWGHSIYAFAHTVAVRSSENTVFTVSAEDAVRFFCWLKAAGASLCNKKCWDGILNMKQWLIYHLPLAYKYLSPEHSICKAVCRYFVKARVEISTNWTWRRPGSQRGADTMWNSSHCMWKSVTGTAVFLAWIFCNYRPGVRPKILMEA